MTVAIRYPHIVKIEGCPATLERLPRIRVAQIVIDYLNHGWSADEIRLHYPHFHLAEIHCALAYYFDHREEIDTEIEREQQLIGEWCRNATPTPVELRLRRQGLLPSR